MSIICNSLPPRFITHNNTANCSFAQGFSANDVEDREENAPKKMQLSHRTHDFECVYVFFLIFWFLSRASNLVSTSGNRLFWWCCASFSMSLELCVSSSSEHDDQYPLTDIWPRWPNLRATFGSPRFAGQTFFLKISTNKQWLIMINDYSSIQTLYTKFASQLKIIILDKFQVQATL